ENLFHLTHSTTTLFLYFINLSEPSCLTHITPSLAPPTRVHPHSPFLTPGSRATCAASFLVMPMLRSSLYVLACFEVSGFFDNARGFRGEQFPSLLSGRSLE